MKMELAIKTYNANGGYFFSKETMKFWGSKIVSDLLHNDCFITIEDNFDRTDKLFTIRRFTNGYKDVETVGTFQGYRYFQDAINAALLIE